ncbi:probable protein, unknown function [Plasmodium reichenowi]|uniref:Uncharacterized protein n=14 Tax=Plasmodium (Laverania) TaxID=418107 RepID=A0A5K1K9E5_PLAF7|nr:conserved Plasmodium protein, unknown function [Plasmodium falciparum 3D7]XP_012762409.1 putative protein, unknown function [Plasmodium reichenowi]ETW19171.1 hypothetical protein PFFVO_01932 [Plasmodium falciparum Vietnam Oak-Knoll (FVO)]ETW37281.1 hypothetical protein PFTANZ_02019 [Plasmodium falciparum Tanzania (2000708)]ETW43519.1 hypothetical protein PFNF135_02056 [Plasmodium falciparum NF135/5.C10]ETW52660.1 hypothetical protein PFUGPA_05666 [Plasmodium falciparum Palo Alto/Uganda]ETW|eukprot:XP_001349503.1 probable protein, unknown function [Plasmodium falciparum 3D7]
MAQYNDVNENNKEVKDDFNEASNSVEKPVYELCDKEQMKYPFFIAPTYDYYISSNGYATTYNLPVVKKVKGKRFLGCC